jgi:hypothetical protein
MSTRFTVDITVIRDGDEDCTDSTVMVELDAPVNDDRLEVLTRQCATQIAAFMRDQFPTAEVTPISTSYDNGRRPELGSA